MTLGDQLFTLKSERSSGRISPIDYYWSLARLLDEPVGGEVPTLGEAEAVRTHLRRIGALLVERLGASGLDLCQKVESKQTELSTDLLAALRSLATLEVRMAHGHTSDTFESRDLQAKCVQALFEVLRQTVPAGYGNPNGPRNGYPRIKAFLPPWAKRGIVQRVRLSERRILPALPGVEYFALLDIDGHLEILTSVRPLKIGRGDQVVLAGVAEHETNMYFNESNHTGQGSPVRAARSLQVLGLLTILGGLAMIVAACFLAVHNVHSVRDISGVAKYFSCAVLGSLLTWLGLGLSVIMARVVSCARLFEQTLRKGVGYSH